MSKKAPLGAGNEKKAENFSGSVNGEHGVHEWPGTVCIFSLREKFNGLLPISQRAT